MAIAQSDTLVILGGNPAYNLNWSPAKPKTIVRLGYYEDETSEKSDWNFPAAHYLESWGDATHQRRNARSDSAVDSTVVRRNDGIGISCATCRRIADESLRYCSQNDCLAGLGMEEAGRSFCSMDFWQIHSEPKPLICQIIMECPFRVMTAVPQSICQTISKSFSTATQRWTTAVTRTTAGCRSCPIPSPR